MADRQQEHKAAVAARERIERLVRDTQPPEVIAAAEEYGFNPLLLIDYSTRQTMARRKLRDEIHKLLPESADPSPRQVAFRLSEMNGQVDALADMRSALIAAAADVGNPDKWATLDTFSENEHASAMLDASPHREPATDLRLGSMVDGADFLEDARSSYLRGYDRVLRANDHGAPGWVMSRARTFRPVMPEVPKFALRAPGSKAKLQEAALEHSRQNLLEALRRITSLQDQVTPLRDNVAKALEHAHNLDALPEETPLRAAEFAVNRAYRTELDGGLAHEMPGRFLFAEQIVEASMPWFEAESVQAEPLIIETLGPGNWQRAVWRHRDHVGDIKAKLLQLDPSSTPVTAVTKVVEGLAELHAWEDALGVVRSIREDPARRFDPEDAGVTDNWTVLRCSLSQETAKDAVAARPDRKGELLRVLSTDGVGMEGLYEVAYVDALTSVSGGQACIGTKLLEVARLQRGLPINEAPPAATLNGLNAVLDESIDGLRSMARAARLSTGRMIAAYEMQVELRELETNPTVIMAAATGQQIDSVWQAGGIL